MHVNLCKGIRANSSTKWTWPIAQLKCLYFSACTIGNKQEDLISAAQMENYDLIAIAGSDPDRKL